MGNTLRHLRKAVWVLLEQDDEPPVAAIVLRMVLMALIMANVLAVILESFVPIAESYRKEFLIFEAFSVTVFSVEYFARVWSSREVGPRWRYMITPLAIIDAVVILPYMFDALFGTDLRILRALRVLRVLKLGRYVIPVRLIGRVVALEAKNLLMILFIVILTMVTTAGLIYAIENEAQPEAFSSIPEAMWWSAATLTTVGYGDVTPVTTLGKIIGVFVMCVGVGLIALPAGLLASRFSLEAEHLRKKRKKEKKQHPEVDSHHPHRCPHCGGRI